MTKFLSGRQKNLKIGITSYSENTQVLEVIGRVGIGSTVFSAGYDLDVRGTSRFSGNVTLGANLYPDTDGLYDVGRAPQIGLGANRWKDANFLGKGTFGTGVSAHDIELGVSSANLIYSTSGNLELNSTSGTTNIDDIVTISGNLGIGTINPTSKLHVVGDTYISGILTATDINSASDIRLKTNIKPFENTLEKIVQINGVSFNWIDSNAKSGGIIAQDVEKVFPELVNDGDHKTVNYNGLIGVLIESIKELKQEVEDLKSRLPGI